MTNNEPSNSGADPLTAADEDAGADADAEPAARQEMREKDERDARMYQREQKFLGGARLIMTVEPILFMLTAIGGLVGPSVTQFFRQEICYMLFNMSFCTELLANASLYPTQYAEVDGMVTTYGTYSMLLSNIPAIFVSWVMGNWSDTISRKFVLNICLISSLVQTLIVFIVMQFSYVIPFQVIFVSSFIGGMTGGGSSCLMAVYGYMGQLVTFVNEQKAKETSSKALTQQTDSTQPQPAPGETDEENPEAAEARLTKNCLQQKTSRYAVLESMLFLGSSIGIFFSGLLASAVGYAYTQLIGFGLMLLTYLYVALWIIDFRPKRSVSLTKLTFTELFAVSNLTDTIRSVYKERPGILREQLLLALTSMYLFGIAGAGEGAILFLYLTSPPFNFTMTLYGYFAGYDSMVSWIMLCFGLPLLKFIIPQSEDTIFILISSVLRFVGLLYLAFITTQLEVFMVGLLEMFQGWMPATLRALVSMSVPTNEQGKIFAIVASGQNIFGIFTGFLYSYWIYPSTVTYFPGCTMVVGAGIMIIPIAEVVYLMHIRLKYKAYSQVRKDATPNETNVTPSNAGETNTSVNTSDE